jgi:hypothetical protein
MEGNAQHACVCATVTALITAAFPFRCTVSSTWPGPRQPPALPMLLAAVTACNLKCLSPSCSQQPAGGYCSATVTTQQGSVGPGVLDMPAALVHSLGEQNALPAAGCRMYVCLAGCAGPQNIVSSFCARATQDCCRQMCWHAVHYQESKESDTPNMYCYCQQAGGSIGSAVPAPAASCSVQLLSDTHARCN